MKNRDVPVPEGRPGGFSDYVINNPFGIVISDRLKSRIFSLLEEGDPSLSAKILQIMKIEPTDKNGAAILFEDFISDMEAVLDQ